MQGPGPTILGLLYAAFFYISVRGCVPGLEKNINSNYEVQRTKVQEEIKSSKNMIYNYENMETKIKINIKQIIMFENKIEDKNVILKINNKGNDIEIQKMETRK